MKRILNILIIILSISCSEDLLNSVTNEPPSEFAITVHDLSHTSATISWNPAHDPDGGIITYRVYFLDHVFADSLVDTTYSFFDLKNNSYYTGSVIAIDSDGAETVSVFSFKTPRAKVYGIGILLQDQKDINLFGSQGYNIIGGNLTLSDDTAPYGYVYDDIYDLSPFVDFR